LNFYDILKELAPDQVDSLYATNYEWPGFTLHGHPAGMLDVLTINKGGRTGWHIRSLFSDVNARICTIAWCLAKLTQLVKDTFHLDDSATSRNLGDLAGLYKSVTERLGKAREARLLDMIAAQRAR
jgi:hypothetical protein